MEPHSSSEADSPKYWSSTVSRKGVDLLNSTSLKEAPSHSVGTDPVARSMMVGA
jgi:hypothetical protein